MFSWSVSSRLFDNQLCFIKQVVTYKVLKNISECLWQKQMCTGTADGTFLCSLQHLLFCVHLVPSTTSCWMCSEFSLLFGTCSARTHIPPFDNRNTSIAITNIIYSFVAHYHTCPKRTIHTLLQQSSLTFCRVQFKICCHHSLSLQANNCNTNCFLSSWGLQEMLVLLNYY